MDEWTPEPLVAPLTAFEENMQEKLPVIVGYALPPRSPKLWQVASWD